MQDGIRSALEHSTELILKCVSVDLEVDATSKRIFSFAAVRPDREGILLYRRGDIAKALQELDEFSGFAEFLLGHNFINFDAHHLAAASPKLELLNKPIIDTLWLNPLAFPRNPYHHLVKHYQDGRLQGGHVNNPELDARLVLTVLENQIKALSELNASNPKAALAFHWLTSTGAHDLGFDTVFSVIRGRGRPSVEEARCAILEMLESEACSQQAEGVVSEAVRIGWPLAYALSWISVAGGDSVMPPWVRHQFPTAGSLVRHLRDTPCSNPDCTWCRSQNDPKRVLRKWFGFDSFRPEPKGSDGLPLQEVIVAEAMAGKDVLGILPTGTGKSVCYQLPALVRFQKTGALTVVISPLVALMADQVDGLKRQGISACVAINGQLSLPERHEALDQVRLGDAAILLISPEQLRSPSVRSILRQREIGYWVLDEAHCISKWGHDFRPDYRYVARFIKEYSGDDPPAPLVCLTATAKRGVVADIRDHFRAKLGVDLALIDGGAVRHNLAFEVMQTNRNRKLGDILSVLEAALPRDGLSGAIIYCATRGATERVADFLGNNGFAAEHFHAGLKPEAKREIQEQFRSGDLRVIVATNAFGMGIDKPDVRLVVHGDIPSSLENYIQEAGRAGRDRQEARCVLLFSSEDIERQFTLSARSRLGKHEISAILRSLRRLDHSSKRTGQVIATPGEIVKEELDHEFIRDSATDDTRVKTAVAWLEEAALLLRDENRVRVFPSSLKIRTLSEAETILQRTDVSATYRRSLLNLVRRLIDADADEGISTDDLSGASGLSGSRLRRALHDLEQLGIASNDTAITGFIHLAVENSSAKRFAAAAGLEADLLRKLQEFAPDLELGETSTLNLRLASQELRELGHQMVRPDVVEQLLRGVAKDGRDEDEGIGSLNVRKLDREHLLIRLQRSWGKLVRTAEIRRKGAEILLRFLEGAAPRNARGNDVQVETTLGALTGALTGDLELRGEISDVSKLLDRSLLWMHEQKVLTLGKGLTIFRPAITVHLEPGARPFTKADFEPLLLHYHEQTLQTHIMAAYAERGLTSIGDALRLAEDYFTLDRQVFVDRWLPGRAAELQRETTPESWRAIVEALENLSQSRIVSDDRERTNVLVLAGPGSGKTRVLVHRIAYLIRVRRENPRGILALVYNRHAATEIRRRLFELIGDDARGVTVSTCHGLAMRLVGASFAEQAEKLDPGVFDNILREAVAHLRGDDLARDEAEAQRDTLIEGYRWIFVDEYQDIGPHEYDLISAVAGRSIDDEDSRLSLFAVGDDDQNIYAFSGASVGFIRRFEADYAARPVHLVENYRSTAHIIQAANRVIAPAAKRMKAGHDIIVNRRRKRDPEGGRLEKLDAVGRGRVQILPTGSSVLSQAVIAVNELERLSNVLPDWNWAGAAVIAREWRFLQPVRSYCEARGISVQMANEDPPSFWRLRETQCLVDWLQRSPPTIRVADMAAWLGEQPVGPWWSVLGQGIEHFVQEVGDRETSSRDVIEWFAEWGREIRKKQKGLLLLTAHRAKGLEFDDVVVLDGGWDRISRNEDRDATRRLYYVAMTRARRSLALLSSGTQHPILRGMDDRSFLIRAVDEAAIDVAECQRVYQALDLSDVDLSYAGRLDDRHSSLKAINRLSTGDPVALRQAGERLLITDENGVIVGRLAQKYIRPEGAHFVKGKVRAIVKRRREDSPDEYRSALKQTAWELIVPELVFALRPTNLSTLASRSGPMHAAI
jgi:ATP-dependent DNA helicase RecQ